MPASGFYTEAGILAAEAELWPLNWLSISTRDVDT